MEAAMSGPNSSLRTARQNESWLGADDQRLLSLHENHRTWTKINEALPGALQKDLSPLGTRL